MFSIRHFLQGRDSKEWCDCYRSCISDCETYCCHRRNILASFLGNDGSPFLDSGFHKVMYCSQPTERRCGDADRSLLPEPDPLRRRLLVVGQRQLVSLAPIDVVAHGAQVESPVPLGVLLVVEITASWEILKSAVNSGISIRHGKYVNLNEIYV